nr:MAG TPA: hypothetical protein [Caudoviricetes sp.]
MLYMPFGKERSWCLLTKLLSLPALSAFNPPTLKPRQPKQVKGGAECFASD